MADRRSLKFAAIANRRYRNRMTPEMEIGTDRKALQINLDPAKYGTFAEIGAGQEVARRFFRIGGAAGTIAKTMSAYDMTFSDAIYGPADRYVSRVRLQTMLDHEYNLLIERLDGKFGAEKTFFVFADTVAARSFKQRSWERMVPPEVVHIIKKREFFGYRRSIAA